MTFDHVIIEDYCDIAESSSEDVDCRKYSLSRVAPYCFDWDESINVMKKCKHFSWCIANNYIVMTNKNGFDIACRRYEENEKDQLITRVSFRVQSNSNTTKGK